MSHQILLRSKVVAPLSSMSMTLTLLPPQFPDPYPFWVLALRSDTAAAFGAGSLIKPKEIRIFDQIQIKFD
jgi:hypothetical protein